MDRDQNEVEDILQPSLRKSLLNECKILEVKRENDLRYNFTRKHSLELRNWPIFNLLNSEFISQIYMEANAAVIVTRDKMVYNLGTNNNGRLGIESKEYKTSLSESCIRILYSKKIETLCGKSIMKFVCCSQMCSALTTEGKETSDFIIQVEDKPIYVHKIILIMHNEYFKTMFSHSWAEKNQRYLRKNQYTILIKNSLSLFNRTSIFSLDSVFVHTQFSYPVYKAFLQYLYTEIIKINTNKTTTEICFIYNFYIYVNDTIYTLSNCNFCSYQHSYSFSLLLFIVAMVFVKQDEFFKLC